MVFCKKLNIEAPGLPFKPFNSEFGQQLYDNVSMQAWQAWLQESPRLMNTYRIDPMKKEGRDFMEQQMRIFFGFVDGDTAETAWRPPE
jgi:Fe-S cluster biosynthesis and repair protein YggX